MPNPANPTRRSTLALLAVLVLSGFGLVASPGVRTQYYLWHYNRVGNQQSALLTQPNRTDAAEQQIKQLFQQGEYYRKQLSALGYLAKFEYQLPHLIGDALAFSRLHRDFSANSPGRSARCLSNSKAGTLWIVDLAENRGKWDKFVAERSTPDFATGGAASTIDQNPAPPSSGKMKPPEPEPPGEQP